MTDCDIPTLMCEFARRQNPYVLHDRLPSSMDVKSYWLALRSARGPIDFADVGLSVFSQNNEDGILLYIFSRIGFGTRKSIEIGCNIDNTTIGVPEGNSINLIVNFDFHGLIIDTDTAAIKQIQHFFATCITTRSYHAMDPHGSTNAPGFYSPVLVPACVSPDNVNQIITASGLDGDIDLLSIDIDGNDIHVWEAIADCSPRVLVIEVNSRLPFEQPYSAGPRAAEHLDKRTMAYWRSAGSSLTKIVASAESRGYVFVGMNNNLINAFFVRKEEFRKRGLIATRCSDYFDHRFRSPESRMPLI